MAKTTERKRKSNGLLSGISKTRNNKTPRRARVKTRNDSSFLSQLQTLRELLHGCSQYSESDLSTCLRQCGYNVQIAAERLITGQFQPLRTGSGTGKISSPAKNGQGDNTGTSAVTSIDLANPVDSPAVKFKPTKMASSSPLRIKAMHLTTPSKADASTSAKANDFVVTKRSKQRYENIKSDIQSMERLKTHNDLCTKPKHFQNESESAEDGMLLCQRWIVGSSTSRRGSIGYHEPLIISTSISNYNKAVASKRNINIVRFKGENVEGTLDSNLSKTLCPLLTYHDQEQKCGDNDGDKAVYPDTTKGPLIKLVARGLMEDQMLNIGMEVPIDLKIYILRPHDFFALFDDETMQDANAHNTHFFYNGRKSCSNQTAAASSKIRTSCILAKAAFALLQFAQYSVLPDFNTIGLRSSGGDGNLDDDGKVSNYGQSQLSQDSADEENIDTSEEGQDGGNEEDTPDWAQMVYIDPEAKGDGENGKKNQSKDCFPEESDPVMLTEKGIGLRKYQRQALHWLIHREEDANAKGSIDFKKQLELLSELAALRSSNNSDMMKCGVARTGVRDINILKGTTDKIIQCEVGPVMVSEDVASKSRSLDGLEDPAIIHPLWQRRFLCDKGVDSQSTKGSTSVFSFYVNELLETASKIAPIPPRECCGGILADSMGLGKTVMLLALMAKDKEKGYNSSSDSKPKAEEKVLVEEASRSSIIEIDTNSDTVSETMGAKNDANGNHTTLVVAPLSLLSQWEDEVTSKSSLSCMTYYGDQSRKLASLDLMSIDVLLTTYGMVQSDFNRLKNALSSSQSCLLSTKFRRVILDEAHLIKNPKTGASKACCALDASRRWCVTGTPISNSLQDVYGLLKFLKHEPWCESHFWKKAVRDPKPTEDDDVQDELGREADSMVSSLARVRQVLRPLLLRRTKDSLSDNGKPILTLPPVETRVVNVILSDEERHFYNALLTKSQAIFEGFIEDGTASKSWFAIFSLLQRLRQSCDHLALTVKSRLEHELDETDNASKKKPNGAKSPGGQEPDDRLNDKFLRDLLDSAKRSEEPDAAQALSKTYSQKVVETLTQCIQENGTLDEECAICLEIPKTDDLAVTPCSHVFCKTCLLDSLNMKKSMSQSEFGECPLCAAQVSECGLICTQAEEESKTCVPKIVKKGEQLDAREILNAALKGKCSSKMMYVLQELDNIWRSDPGSKILIFSQYLGMFDLLQAEFSKRCISAFRLDGKMSLKARSETVKSFNSYQTTNALTTSSADTSEVQRGVVLLASMKACGVGMNLTAASSVLIVDPWWNYALESQCINRIHRIGQNAPVVRVRKFIVTNSVEEKIVRMQERKKGMASEVLSDKSGVIQSANATLDDLKSILGR